MSDECKNEYFDGLKLKKKQILFLILLSLGTFLEQMDLYNYSVLSPAIMKEWGLSINQIGFILSTYGVGAILGALIFGNLADKIGRKKSMGIACIFGGTGALLSSIAPSFLILICVRAVSGFGMAGALLIGTPYLVEMVPSNKRARFQAVLGLVALISIPMSSVLAKKMVAVNVNNWRIIAAIPAIGIAVGILFLTLAYESPRWLVSNNKVAEGKEIFKKITGTELYVDPDLECIVKKVTYKEVFNIMFSEAYRKRTILFFVIFGILFDAGFMFMQWLPTLLTNEGMPIDKVLGYQQIASFALLVAPIYIMVLGDKGGRKKPYGAGLIFVAIGLIIISIAGSNDSKMLAVGVFIAGAFYMVNNGLAPVYRAECFPTRVRLIIAGIFATVMRVSSVIANSVIAPSLYKHVGFSAYFTVCAFIYLGVAILIFAIGPRTAGISLEELNKEKNTDKKALNT